MTRQYAAGALGALPIRRGAARALGLRAPARRPIAIVRCAPELTAAEREEYATRFAEAQGNPRLLVLASPDGRTVTPRRQDLPYMRSAIRRRLWPFRPADARG